MNGWMEWVVLKNEVNGYIFRGWQLEGFYFHSKEGRTRTRRPS